MKHLRRIVLGLLLWSLVIVAAGCGVGKYNWHFGLGTDAQDGVSTEADVDRVKDGVVPAEPEEPDKAKKGEGSKSKPPEKKKPS